MTDRLPLEGIRIADFTQVVIGPYLTMMLAEMGAEVIKVETISRTQLDTRTIAGVTGLNASKKGITLDLKNPKAVEIAKRLVAVSDIAAENFGTGVMDRLGLGYDELRKVKPDIIMVSNASIARSGPMKNAIGYFAEVNAFAGYTYLTGYRDVAPGQVGGIWTDHFTGTLALYLVLSALHYRERTGKGQFIETSMAENVIASMPELILDYLANGRDLGQQENEDPYMSPHNMYRCSGFDRWIAIAVSNDAEWRAMCDVMGDPPWSGEARFSDQLGRLEHRKDLDALITEWTSQHEDYEIMRMLQAAGVAAGPVLDSKGLADDPQLKERGYLVDLGEVEGAHLAIPALPFKLSDCPPGIYKVAPGFGEHNHHVLSEILGYSEAEIGQLIEENVLS